MLIKKISAFALGSVMAASFAEAGWLGRSCNPNLIKIEHSVGFSSVFKSNKLVEAGNDGFKVDIPVTINGDEGCFTQEHGYLFGFKKNESEFKGSITVKAPQFEFVDIEDGHVETYVQIENKSGPFEAQVKLTSFVCAGESVLSVHTFSNQIKDIVDLVNSKMKVGFSSIIATGAAATALQGRLKTNKLIKSDVDDVFVQEYLKRSHFNGRLESLQQKVVAVPSVLLYSNLQSESVNQTSLYQTRYVNQLGCTKEFSNVMREFHLSNLKDGWVGQLHVETDDDGFEVTWK